MGKHRRCRKSENGGDYDDIVQYLFNVETVRCREMMEGTRFVNHDVESTSGGRWKEKIVHYLSKDETERKNLYENLMNDCGSSFRQTLYCRH